VSVDAGRAPGLAVVVEARVGHEILNAQGGMLDGAHSFDLLLADVSRDPANGAGFISANPCVTALELDQQASRAALNRSSALNCAVPTRPPLKLPATAVVSLAMSAASKVIASKPTMAVELFISEVFRRAVMVKRNCFTGSKSYSQRPSAVSRFPQHSCEPSIPATPFGEFPLNLGERSDLRSAQTSAPNLSEFRMRPPTPVAKFPTASLMGPNANERDKPAIDGTCVFGIVSASWIGNLRSALGFWNLPEALRIFKAGVLRPFGPLSGSFYWFHSL
jgi:hypothetical protein